MPTALATRIVASLCALLVGTAAAQPVAPTLWVDQVELSRYPVVKTFHRLVDGTGRAVVSAREDIHLLIDGKDVVVAADVKPVVLTGEPIFLVVLVQLSSDVTPFLPAQRLGLKRLVEATRQMKGSKLAILGFAGDTHRLHEFADRPEKLDERIERLSVLPEEGTEINLANGVRTAIDLLNTKEVPDDGRKVVVVIASGVDSTASAKDFTNLGERAVRYKITVDTVALAAGHLPNLAGLARDTHGIARVAARPDDLPAQLSNTAEVVEKQMVALFQSPVVGDDRVCSLQLAVVHAGQSITSRPTPCIFHGGFSPRPAPTPMWHRRGLLLGAIAAGPALALALLTARWLHARRRRRAR